MKMLFKDISLKENIMKRNKILSKLMVALVTIGLSGSIGAAGLWKDTNNLVDTTWMDTTKLVDTTWMDSMKLVDSPFNMWTDKNKAEYMLTDKDDGGHMYLDGVDGHKMMSDTMSNSEMVGDTITNLDTGKSGVITGVSTGTMNVMKPNGKMVSYQVMEFKVKKTN
jgi:hypothetical protein